MCLLFVLISRIFAKKRSSAIGKETNRSRGNEINNGDWSHRLCWMNPSNDVATSKNLKLDKNKGTI